MDGYVVIGTSLDSKQLDKDIAKAEKELQRYEKEAQRLTDTKAKLDIDTEKTGANLEKVLNKIEEIDATIADKKQMVFNFEGSDDYQKLLTQRSELNNKAEIYSSTLSNIERKQGEITVKMKENTMAQQQTNAALDQMQAKTGITKVFSGVSGQVNSIGNGVQSITRKVARWGLALLSIRGIYGMLSSAASTLTAQNDQMAANIQYLKNMIASALAPVIQWIINLVYTLLTYLNYITKAFFGLDLFAGAMALSMKQAEKSAGGVGKGLGKAKKEAEEMKKQLAGFDEMNVLQDTSNKDTGSGGGGGAGGGGGMPMPDLPDVPIPEWLKWIAKHKDEVIAGLLGIAAGLTALKLGATALQALGIGVLIAGIAYAVMGLLQYLKDPTFANLGQFIQGIGAAIIGLGIALFPILGWPAIIVGAVVLLVGTLIKYWEQIKAFLQGIVIWLFEMGTNIGGIPGMIFKSVAEMISGIISALDMIINGVKGMIDGIIKIVKGFAEGDMSMVMEGLKQLVSSWIDAVIGFISLMIEWIAGIVRTLLLTIVNLVANLIAAIWNLITGLWDFITGLVGGIANWIYTKAIKPVIDIYNALWTSIKAGAQSAWDKVKSIFGAIPGWFNGVISKIVSNFSTIGTKVGNAIGGAFKGAINKVLSGIENILNTPIRAINGLIGAINEIPGVSMKKLSTLKLPRLAKGGIINMPGRGVPVGGAIAGERGAEAVIPLTDSQQMALIGEAIGKYVNINATVPVYVGNRQIAREIKRINAENDFAYNR